MHYNSAKEGIQEERSNQPDLLNPPSKPPAAGKRFKLLKWLDQSVGRARQRAAPPKRAVWDTPFAVNWRKIA
jgi:hypothetical protein